MYSVVPSLHGRSWRGRRSWRKSSARAREHLPAHDDDAEHQPSSAVNVPETRLVLEIDAIIENKVCNRTCDGSRARNPSAAQRPVTSRLRRTHTCRRTSGSLLVSVAPRTGAVALPREVVPDLQGKRASSCSDQCAARRPAADVTAPRPISAAVAWLATDRLGLDASDSRREHDFTVRVLHRPGRRRRQRRRGLRICDNAEPEGHDSDDCEHFRLVAASCRSTLARKSGNEREDGRRRQCVGQRARERALCHSAFAACTLCQWARNAGSPR